MTLVSFMCGHLHEAPSPTDKFVAENMMDSYGMLICPECKHLPVTARRRYGHLSLPEIPGTNGRLDYSYAGLSLRDRERKVVWGIEPKPVVVEVDTSDMPDRRELRSDDEIARELAIYRSERDNRVVRSGTVKPRKSHKVGGGKRKSATRVRDKSK